MSWRWKGTDPTGLTVITGQGVILRVLGEPAGRVTFGLGGNDPGDRRLRAFEVLVDCPRDPGDTSTSPDGTVIGFPPDTWFDTADGTVTPGTALALTVGDGLTPVRGVHAITNTFLSTWSYVQVEPLQAAIPEPGPAALMLLTSGVILIRHRAHA